jgi:hypothetical protein
LEDWISCYGSISKLQLKNEEIGRILLHAKSCPDWVKEKLSAWVELIPQTVAEEQEVTLCEPSDEKLAKFAENLIKSWDDNVTPRKISKPKTINADYLRFLSLFVEMTMTQTNRWFQSSDQSEARISRHLRNLENNSNGNTIPRLPGFRKEILKQTTKAISTDDFTEPIFKSIIGQDKLKLVLWLHQWAQSSPTFCSCENFLKPDENILSMKLQLPLDLLKTAIETYCGDFVETPAIQHEKPRQSPAVKIRVNAANEAVTKIKPVPKQRSKKEIPQYYFGESSVSSIQSEAGDRSAQVQQVLAHQMQLYVDNSINVIKCVRYIE